MNLIEFIKTQIETVDDLRALLLFHTHPDVEWDANGIAGKLYIPPAMAREIATRLVSRRCVIALGNPPRFRFQPQSPELAELISELADLDRSRPVSLINLIYARTKDIQAFADAFKIKKDKGL